MSDLFRGIKDTINFRINCTHEYESRVISKDRVLDIGGRNSSSKTKCKPFDVVYYIFYEKLDVLGPYLNAFQMWLDHGYNVKVFSLHDERINGAIPSGSRQGFSHHCVLFPALIKLMEKATKFRGGAITKLLKMVYFAIFCFVHTNKRKKSVLIGTDPPGLLAAFLVSKITKDPYIYSVQEILLSADIKRVVDRFIKYLERKCNKGVLFTVEFDETRAALLARDNNLRPESMLVVPNTPIGSANGKRSLYLRKKFNIPDHKKIALYTGGIADYNLTYEHIESIETWPENVVLVMHCWGSKEEIENLKDFARSFKAEIYFSTEMLSIDKIDNIYRSSDIGFAMYGDQDLNHKYAGMSSGKMFNFMKACVPLITNDTPSCKKSVEETGCGICIRDISEVSKAIRKILKNENNFRLNCQKNFSTFNFEHYHNKLINDIEHHCYLHS